MPSMLAPRIESFRIMEFHETAGDGMQEIFWVARAGGKGAGAFRARALPGTSSNGRTPHPPPSAEVLRPFFVGMAKLTRTPDPNPLPSASTSSLRKVVFTALGGGDVRRRSRSFRE